MTDYKSLSKLAGLMERLNSKATYARVYRHDLDQQKVDKFMKLIEKALLFPLFPDTIEEREKKS